MGLSVPISWLNDYVSTSNTEELAERLTFAGLEIEKIETIGQQWDENFFCVAELLNVKPHPNADRLSVVSVNNGQGPIELVCGAPNIRVLEGNMPNTPVKVALAMEGAAVFNAHEEGSPPITLKAAEIRGVPSSGMLCSEKELGISENHDGVMLLPEDAPTGTPLKRYLGDEVLHFDIKGGFSHLLAIYGIAREVAALTEMPIKKEIMESVNRYSHSIDAEPPFVKLSIQNPEYCARYSALLIENVTIGPSPFWMQQRLLRAGMRPINNIVDITNYVMLEIGQPLHAFDYDLLKKRAGNDKPLINVRCAENEETMVTLDGVEHTFDQQMLLITDSIGPVAIAGVMGGSETEVSETTKTILLESANFEFLNNRRTAQLLKFKTEACERFGKKIDPEATLVAAARAAELIVKYAGGKLNEHFGDLYPTKKEATVVELDPQYARRLLGIDLSESEMIHLLERLDFKVHSAEKLQVTVPSYRMDVAIAADLVEEIGRCYGYNRMPETLLDEEIPKQYASRALLSSEKIKDLMVEQGLDEVINYSIIDLKVDGHFHFNQTVDPNSYVPLKNPLSAERTHMRRDLLPGLLVTAQKNTHYFNQLALFEVGSVFHPIDGQILPNEPQCLAILMTGQRFQESWLETPKASIDFYDLKGVIEGLLDGLHILKAKWQPAQHHAYHPGRCAEVLIGEHSLGYVGQLHPKVSSAFNFTDSEVYGAELNLKLLQNNWNDEQDMVEVSPYEPIYEDLAFVMDDSLASDKIAEYIHQVGQPLVQKVRLFDVYKDERLGTNKKSLAYAITYQSFDRTLTDKDVEPIREKIIASLDKQMNVSLRS